MHRRISLGGVAGILSVPRPARAQQAGKVYRVGVLESITTARNLNASTLGLTVPSPLLLRADDVIE